MLRQSPDEYIGTGQHDNYTIVINSVLGKEVLRDRINSNSKTINLKSFQSGVYYVRLISSNGKTSVRKLIVVK